MLVESIISFIYFSLFQFISPLSAKWNSRTDNKTNKAVSAEDIKQTNKNSSQEPLLAFTDIRKAIYSLTTANNTIVELLCSQAEAESALLLPSSRGGLGWGQSGGYHLAP